MSFEPVCHGYVCVVMRMGGWVSYGVFLGK
jgi:hypothetical protein